MKKIYKLKLYSLLALVGSGIALGAPTTTFSFDSDSSWDGQTAGTGYPNSGTDPNTTYTASQTINGLTMTFNASFEGSAEAATRNLVHTDTSNPKGFNIATKASWNNITVDTDTGTIVTRGKLQNYQRWDITFSKSVKVIDFTIDDIDNNIFQPTSTSPELASFWDFVGAEGWTNSLGDVGTGIDAQFTAAAGLAQSQIKTNSNNDQLQFVTTIEDTGNPTNDPDYRTSIGFGDTYVKGFSIYAFTKRDPNSTYTNGGTDTYPTYDDTVNLSDNDGKRYNTHRVSLYNSVVEVEVIPEPTSTALLGIGALSLLVRRRR